MSGGIDTTKLARAREEGEIYYKSIGKVHCPYFGTEVAFNALGLEHLKFKDKRHSRSARDQYIRFRLIKLAPEILKLSRTLQGISHRKNMEKRKIRGKWQTVMCHVTYYEFIAVMKEKTRVRVIVKQVDDGPKYFWSIIPFWKMDKFTGGKLVHNGKPEHD